MMDRPRNMKVGEEATLIRKLEAQDGAIFALDWSPDGKLIAVAGAGPKVNLYEAESGVKVAACGGHSAGIYAVAFSPDGGRLATGGFDGQVRFYNSADCTLQKAMVPVPWLWRDPRPLAAERRRAMKLFLWIPTVWIAAAGSAPLSLSSPTCSRAARRRAGRSPLHCSAAIWLKAPGSNRRCPPPSRRSGPEKDHGRRRLPGGTNRRPGRRRVSGPRHDALRNFERPTLLDRHIPRVYRGRIAPGRSAQQ